MKTSRMISVLLCFLFLFSACASGQKQTPEKDTVFRLAKEEEFAIYELIAAQMKEYYWKIDKKSLTYSPAFVPTGKDEQYKAMKAATQQLGQDIDAWDGKEALLFSSQLLHFNSEQAGVVYFYVIDGDIKLTYYIDAVTKKVYGLRDRNTYTVENPFQRFENISKEAAYSTLETDIVHGDMFFVDEMPERTILALLEEHQLYIYEAAPDVKMLAKINAGNKKQKPFSMAKVNDMYFVLMGEEIVSSDEESESVTRVARHIEVFDSRFVKKKTINIPANNITTLTTKNGLLGLASEADIRFYSPDDFTEREQYYFRHSIREVLCTTLYDDGADVMFVSSGQDLFCYQIIDNAYILIWSTHLGVDTYEGKIFAQDTNGDMVKEIYISDVDRTTIRYVLTPCGFVSQNATIDFGQRIYPFSIGNKTAIMKVMDIDNSDVQMVLEQ